MIITALVLMVRIIEYLILGRCIISWLPLDRENKYINFLYLITEPFLAPIRALLSKTRLGRGDFMLDLSPLIAILALDIISRIISKMVYMF